MNKGKSESFASLSKSNLPSVSSEKLKKKKKQSNKLPKLKIQKQPVKDLLVRSISSIGISDTLTVSNDKIETVLKHKKQLGIEKLQKLEHERIDNEKEDEDYFTFSLTSPGKLKHGGEHSGDLSSVHSRSAMGNSIFSNTDDYSLDSSASILSHYTSHELIAKINNRVIKNQPPPEFVPSLRSLLPSQLSWNHRLPANHNPDNPLINILPCLVPLEVILAKADRRIRKRAKASKERKKQNETRLQQLEQSLVLKRTRAERVAAQITLQQMQCGWMRALVIARYMMVIKPQFEQSNRAQKAWFNAVRSARIVQKLFLKWFYTEVRARLHRKYLGAFGRVEGALKMHLRIFRKRMAVRKLKSFLIEYKGQHKMSVVVHRFLHSVRRIQRVMRDFIQCKYAKITALGKIWDKLEYSFIRKKLEQRKLKIAGTTMSKKSLDKDLRDMKSSALDEILEKDKEWHKIHKQMEKVVSGLRTAGLIVEETEEQIIEKLRVPEPVKIEILRGLVEKLRKSFYTDQRTLMRKKIEQDSRFNEAHAVNLLLGDGKEVMRLFREKLNKKLVNLKYKPFMLFS
jgi:hypothetical protein